MKKYLLIITVISVSLFTSCDELENPEIVLNNQYLEGVYGPVPNFAVLDNPPKNILVEEFTGHLCGFCPPATAALKSLDETLGNRLVAVAVHAGTLAEVGSAPFETDYTTEIGNTYWGQLQGGFNPCARIDRTGGISNFYIDNQWANKISSQMAMSPDAAMQMVTSYVAGDKNLNVHVHSQFLQNLSGDFNLVVLLVESKVISAQEWYNHDPEVVTDYEHNHLIRAGLTGAEGIPLISDPQVNDQPIKSFTFPMSDAWVVNNCTIAAFIVNNTTGEVVNAVESEVSE